jgi:hypothetical protein
MSQGIQVAAVSIFYGPLRGRLQIVDGSEQAQIIVNYVEIS